MPTIRLSDFSGGLNLRDSPIELAPNETPNALNWTLDTRGAAKQRGGCLNAVALPGVSGTAAYLFYSGALNQWLCARETAGAPNTLRLHTRPGDLSGSWTDRGLIQSTPTASAAFADFPGTSPKVVISTALGSAASTGGTWTWDGTTLTSVSTTVRGTSVALWQNRVWVAGYQGYDANGNPTRLFACKVGDPATWAAPDGLTVDLRDKDADELTGLGILTNSLHVFKFRSAYRVSDSSTGAFTTVDSTAGCQGPGAVVSLRGRLYTWGADSLYEWDGIGPGKRVGDKAQPLFTTDAALVGGAAGLCGGALSDRALYAYPSAAGGTNDRLLEYDPEHKWLMKHQLASTSKDEISSFSRKGADLYAAVRDGNIMFKVFSETPGVDDGALFASNNFRTRWIQPADGKLCRISKAQVEGLTVTGGTTTLKFRVYKDWDTSAFDEYDTSADLRGGSAGVQVTKSIVQSLGHARSFAFEFVAGTASGAAEIDALTLDWVPLER